MITIANTHKTIKHIIFHWKGRELLRYPYPIFIARPLIWCDPEYGFQISHSYRGSLFFLYFTAYSKYPMEFKTKLPKMQRIISSEDEDELDYEDRIMPKPIAHYSVYFEDLVSALSLPSESDLVYKIYSEMFDQSQQLVFNMDLDKENLFEGVEDIKIDVSESPYKEDLLIGQNYALVLAQHGLISRDSLYSVESYFDQLSYRFGLEETKNFLLTHLGEQNSDGYFGVNENFFKQYTSRLQLVFLVRIHQRYVYDFILVKSSTESIKKINFWKMPNLTADFSYNFDFFLNLHKAERFYLRRFYRKFKLLNK